MDWPTYVRRTVGKDERQLDIAHRTGVDQTTISRWLSGESRRLTPDTVTRFAHGYGRPVLEAFIYAGLISKADAKQSITPLPEVTLGQLLIEVERRTGSKAAS